MDDRRVAEYFVVAGLPQNPVPLAEFSCDGANLKSTHSLPPVTDIGVVNRSIGEVVPEGYFCIEHTPGGIIANLNHGVLRSQEIFLCYRRGMDKPPLVDIGVLFEGRERLLPDSQVVEFSVGNHNANINPNGVPTFITYRRATEESSCNELVVSDICIILTSKGEIAPHSYCTIERNINKGTMVGSDIFLCYRKSVNRTNYLAYKAGILDQYPFIPRPNFPLPDNLALFCLPMGATLEAWPPQAVTPDHVFSTFVLTIVPSPSFNNSEGMNEGVEKVYGAAITFYERYSHHKLTTQQREELQLNDHFGRRNLIHTSKCICILSMWPFFDTFEKFLKYLLKMAHSANHKVPIERYIWHMLECVPFPSARRPRILIQLDASEGISLAQLEDSPISLSGASFRKLVMSLRPEGCMLVLLYALTEQKVLMHSHRPDVLTAVAEALTMIIFPFHWQCPYIPLCPLGLSDLLDAPTPFLLGLDSRFFDLYDPPSHVICIDLDTAAFWIPEDKRHLSSKLLPKKAARALKASLDALCGTIRDIDEQLQKHHLKPNLMLDQNIDVDFKMKRKEQELEVEIQETFLRFTANILRGYNQYLLPIVTVKPNSESGTPSLFDVEGFVRSRDRSYQKFYEMLVSTQMFSKFMEERSFVSDKDISLVFFDDCIEKVKEEEFGSRILEVEPASSEITFFLLPPEPPLHAPIDGYAYEGFPKLRQDIFPVKDLTKSLPSELSTPQKGPGVGSPGSPLARRSKHEVKSAQKLASKYYQTPMMWAKCLLSTCFSLWFAQLPGFITIHAQKGRVLDLAFFILQRMQKLSVSHQDEVCYRVMMQLCGVYSKPVLAVKTLCEMRNAGIIPNAITYGYYNRALLESKWNPSNLLWNKLRNVMLGVRAFRESGLERAERRRSSLLLDEVDKLSSDSTSRLSVESGTSVDSHPPIKFKTDTMSSDPGYCSISDNCEPTMESNVSPISNTISTCNGDLSSERSESVPSLSPMSPPNPEPPPFVDTTSSSSDTSYSSPTATVAYDTAPSSPLKSPPSNIATLTLSVSCNSSNVVNNAESAISNSSTLPAASHSSSPMTISDSSIPTAIPHSSTYTSTPPRITHVRNCTATTPTSKSSQSKTLSPPSPKPTKANLAPRRSCPTVSVLRSLDFSQSDQLRRRLGSVVKSSTAGLSSGAQLSLLETHPLLVNTAGLLMTSPLDSTYLDPDRPPRERPTDLAEQLLETLEKYDQIQEPSMPVPTTFDPSHTDRGPPDYLRSNSYGKDDKIVKKLLQLVYSSEEAEAENTESAPSVTGKEISKDISISDKQESKENKKSETKQDDFIDYDDDDDDVTPSEQNTNLGTRNFFARNTSERLSSLWKKGVLGADEKFRGMWRKTTPRNGAKETNKASASGVKATNNDNKPPASGLKRYGGIPPRKQSPAKENIDETEKLPQIKPSRTRRKLHNLGSLAFNRSETIAIKEDSSPTESNSSCLPLVSPDELVKGSGRHEVLSGDPLGALEQNSLNEEPNSVTGDPSGALTQNSVNEEAKSACTSAATSPVSPLESSPFVNKFPSKHSRRVCRSNTFTSTSSSSGSNPEEDCPKGASSKSLWTLNPPFSGEEFKSTSKDLQILSAQDNSEIAPEDSMALSWTTPFKLPLSGTSTLGLASSVASQGIRQASKHIESLRTMYIDPAMTELASQSSFNYRKSEIISGSLSSMKSAVTSLSKKYNIFRDAIIPTPSKIGWRDEGTDEDVLDGFWSRRESYEASLTSLEDGNFFRRTSLKTNTDEAAEIDRSLPSSWSLLGPFCLGIWITSCSKCHNCKGVLYDEEIMAGWRPDDSNLNTRCWHCNKLTVPLLTVTLYYLRHLPKDSLLKCSFQSAKDQNITDTPKHGPSKKTKKDLNGKSSSCDEIIAHILEKGKRIEPLTVPYLSPLVLRKELETMLGHDGDSCLTQPSFPDHHPILYWNMLWYFSRLRLPSHLSGLCLPSLSQLKDRAIHESWKEADWRHVFVRCLWDNTVFHQEVGSPLYMQWKENYNPSILVKALTPHRARTPKDVLESFLTLLHVNQVDRCVEMLIQALKKRPAELKYNHFPIYRDLLFFALTALPRDDINMNGFEQEFRREFEKAQPKHSKILTEADGAPPIPAVFCRKYFMDLSL